MAWYDRFNDHDIGVMLTFWLVGVGVSVWEQVGIGIDVWKQSVSPMVVFVVIGVGYLLLMTLGEYLLRRYGHQPPETPKFRM